MKNQTVLKYPHSASLFEFCKRVLKDKLGSKKAIDQDVGRILGLDPSDCSQWKRGKKQIHSIFAIRQIAKNLDVDETLVIDIACGNTNSDEGFQEITGHNDFQLSQDYKNSARKSFLRENAQHWTKDHELEFENTFHLDIQEIRNAVEKVHSTIRFEEGPLFFPELYSYYPEIVFHEENRNLNTVHSYRHDGHFHISYRKDSEVKASQRFQIAQALTKYFLPSKEISNPSLREHQNYIEKCKSTLFASYLLVPTKLLKKEISKFTVPKDTLSHLAEIFWVTKSFMNLRLMILIQQEI